MSTNDLYSLLGVAHNVTADEIKAAYRLAARRFHPDVNPHPAATEEFKLIANAYGILSDPAQRAVYDAALRKAGSGPLVSVRWVPSRDKLSVQPDPQILYTLINITPSFGADTELPAPPVNLCIVIDRSTSMQGARLDQVKASVLQVIDSLRDNDTFSVVAYSDKAEVVVPAQQGNAEKTLAKAKVSTIKASGGTEILQGLMVGLTELHQRLSSSAVNHLILLTDGRTYGDEDDCILLAMLAATDGIGITGLGIGDEWNDKFLDELATCTGGNAAYVSGPDQVKTFIWEKVRGLGATYAERLTIQVTTDVEVKLLSAVKLGQEAGQVPIDGTSIRLGALPKQQGLSVLLKFLIPPVTAEGDQPISRLALYADVVSLGRRGERTTIDITLPAAVNPPRTPPPAQIVEALSKLSQYNMQEKAWQEVAAGEIENATKRLSTLGTRMLASGQTDLAKATLAEARRLEKTHVISEEAKKNIKYGTRALLLAPPPSKGTQSK
jgi:Ca-activated chloride channel family protein